MASENQVQFLAGAIFFKFFPLSFQRPLAWKIHVEEPHPHDDAMLIFLNRQFTYPVYLRPDLSDIWPFARVFESSSGLHREFLTPNKMILSLVHLGTNEQALYMMQKITQQTMYIVSLKELY